MKVLVIRFSSIGDIVLTSPVLRCLKQQLNAEVHFVTKKRFSSLVQHNPNIDVLHTIDNDINEVLNDLKSASFDLIIDLHNNLRSNLLIRKLKVRSIGFDKLNTKKWLFANFKINRLPKKHLVDRYFSSLQTIGLTNDGLGLDHCYSPQTKDLDNWGLQAKNYVVLAIGGTYLTKRLTNDQILKIIEGTNSQAVLIGGLEDVVNSKEILKGSSKSILDLCGKINLDESAKLIESASVVICHDSGMMHIASAYNTPIISVWGNTHPDFGMYPYLVKEEQEMKSALMQVDLNCRPCSKLGYDKCPKGHFNCIKLQNVDEIVKNCNSIEAGQ